MQIKNGFMPINRKEITMLTLKSNYTTLLFNTITENDEDANINMDYAFYKKLFIDEKTVYFRNFGDAVVAYLHKKTGKTWDECKYWKCFLEEAKKAGFNDLTNKTNISSTTWRDWLKGSTPNATQEKGRKKVFAVAFILGLDEKETKDFIRKSCFCRPMDYRNNLDCVFYYCIKNKKSWDDACRILQTIEVNKQNNASELQACNSQMSISLISDYDQIKDDNDLINYCSVLNGQDQRLTNYVKNLIAELDNDESNNDNGIKTLRTLLSEEQNKQENLKKQFLEYFNVEGTDTKKNKTNSVQSLINSIVGYSIGRDDSSINNIMSGVTARITNNFPNGNVFSEKQQPNTDCLRKTLILLESYKYWCNNYKKVKCKNCDREYYAVIYPDFDGDIIKKDCPKCSKEYAKKGASDGADYQYLYQEAINQILNDNGCSELYWGDPFDALMLCCSNPCDGVEPIDKFRWIMDVLINDKLRNRNSEKQKKSNDIASDCKDFKNDDKEAEKEKGNDEKRFVPVDCCDCPNKKECQFNEIIKNGNNDCNEPYKDKFKKFNDIAEEDNDFIEKLWNSGHSNYKSGSETEKKLLELVNGYQCKKARDELASSYYIYVIKHVRKYYAENSNKCQSNGYSLLDLIQSAIVVICDKIPKYDSKKKVSLCTYLTACINNIFKEKKPTPYTLFKEWLESKQINVTNKDKLTSDSFYKAFYPSKQINYDCSESSDKKIKDFFGELGIDERFVRDAIDHIQNNAYKEISINASLSNDDEGNELTLEDVIPDASEDIQTTVENNDSKDKFSTAINDAINKLTDDDKDIICYEYGLCNHNPVTSIDELKINPNKQLDDEDVRRAEARFYRIFKGIIKLRKLD